LAGSKSGDAASITKKPIGEKGKSGSGGGKSSTMRTVRKVILPLSKHSELVASSAGNWKTRVLLLRGGKITGKEANPERRQVGGWKGEHFKGAHFRYKNAGEL